MYVALHGRYLAKRMPETGARHHPSCPSFEPEKSLSGLGELIGNAVRESPQGDVTLRVSFAWSRREKRGARSRGAPATIGDEERAKPSLSLRGLTHFLFERAGFNRWAPAMEGKRTQGVLHRHLMQAAASVSAKGVALATRFYVPEAFNQPDHAAAVRRRRERLAVLNPHDGEAPLAVLMAELKHVELASSGACIWLRHMPDAPLLVDARTWQRTSRTHASLLEARYAAHGRRVRVLVTALIRARREHTYELDTASMMLASDQWIPLEGVHELELIEALVNAGRRFVKPLRYDALSAAPFASALLLDAGDQLVPLHVVSAFVTPRERDAKARMLRAAGPVWTWHTSGSMPDLPPIAAGRVRPVSPTP
jgi:hypothetical protein